MVTPSLTTTRLPFKVKVEEAARWLTQESGTSAKRKADAHEAFDRPVVERESSGRASTRWIATDQRCHKATFFLTDASAGLQIGVPPVS